jgi:hypothetical protein
MVSCENERNAPARQAALNREFWWERLSEPEKSRNAGISKAHDRCAFGYINQCSTKNPMRAKVMLNDATAQGNADLPKMFGTNRHSVNGNLRNWGFRRGRAAPAPTVFQALPQQGRTCLDHPE